jgi:hypothetical protein
MGVERGRLFADWSAKSIQEILLEENILDLQRTT